MIHSTVTTLTCFSYLLNPACSEFKTETRLSVRTPPLRLIALNATANKPQFCTADELHYVSVPSSHWNLALWRYIPSPKAPMRNHPLLLLSGVGSNAIGYDLAPGCSFARYMSSQGFDTWTLELRGAGLSKGARSREDSDAFAESEASSAKEKRTQMVNKPGLKARQISSIANQINNFSHSLVDIIEQGHLSVSPQFIDIQERFSTTIEDFQQQLDLIVEFNWDFDHYLEEDVPAAMGYIRTQCKPKNGKLLAIGHSMGGILLYAMLSQNCCQRRDFELSSVITLGSSLDYTTSKSSVKFLLPLADPAQVLNVPVIPMGSLLAAAHPFASHPPYVLSWLKPLISAQNMMHPESFEKLVLNNFCTVPTKLLLQLTTAFRDGGLCDRSRTVFYKDHLHKNEVPVLAIAGDQDLICPPEAVYETVKRIPKHLVTYKVFGEPCGPHYAHYDLVGGRLAANQVYPRIIEFLTLHDRA